MQIDLEHAEHVTKAWAWAWAVENLRCSLSLHILGGTLCAFARSTGHAPLRPPPARPSPSRVVAAARARRNPFAM